MSEATVSIVLAYHRQAAFLAAAVASGLAQTRPALEIIVVDDGSPDDCRALLAPFPQVHYVRKRNGGVASARNLGAHLASGDYLIFLDADDVLLPQAIADGLAAFAASPDLALAFGRCGGIDVAGKPIDVPLSPRVLSDVYERLLRDCPIWSTSTVMVSRRWFWRVGAFSTRLRNCEDFDFYLRIARAGCLISHDAVVSHYRRHPGGKSHNSLGMLFGALSALRGQRHALRRNPGDREALAEGFSLILRNYGEQATRQRYGLRGLGKTWRYWREWILLTTIDRAMARRLFLLAFRRSI